MRPKLYISPAVLAGLCVFFFLDTQGLLLPFALAAICHEGGHLLFLRLLRVPVYEVRLGLTGTVLRTAVPGYGAELLIAAAGPAVNLLLALVFCRLWRPFFLVNLLLAAYNLLPAFPLDGGRLLKVPFVLCFGAKNGEAISNFLSCGVIALICGFCIHLTCHGRLGLLPCLFAALLVLRLPEKPFGFSRHNNRRRANR